MSNPEHANFGTPPDEPTNWSRALFVMFAAFGTYFCMFGFRKPFTASLYEGTSVGGVDFKTVLVTSQVAGYMVAKFIGIKIIAEMPYESRSGWILRLILAALATLIAFALLPRPWNAICLFLNGMSLGMVFGLVLGFLEGRQLTELLTAGLCTSFILADGVAKSVGTYLLDQGISEEWMPTVAGLVFLLPFALCVAALSRTAPPSSRDIDFRSERGTLDRAGRRQFLRRYGVGLAALSTMYLLVTIIRSIRADFAPEIWNALGYAAAPSTFTYSEMFVALGVMLCNGAAILIINNRHAFFTALVTCGMGFALLAYALFSRSQGNLAGFPFMVLIGLGMYLPYVAVHTTIFERLLAMTRERGNIGFLMYVVDSVGYLGFIAVMLARNFFPVKVDILSLLTVGSWIAVALSGVCLIASGLFFRNASPSKKLP